MQTKKLVTLVVIAVVLCVVATVVRKQQNTSNAPGVEQGKSALSLGDALMPQVDEKADQIARIEVRKDAESIVLARKDDGSWVIQAVADRDMGPEGYPVDPSKVTKLVFELAEVSMIDRLTKNAEKYSIFGVEGDDGTDGTYILSDDSGDPIATLLRGKERSTGDEDAPPQARGASAGRYYRHDDDAYVYLAKDELPWLSCAISSWAKTDVMTLDDANIVGLSIDHAATESVHYEWVDERLVLASIPEGMQEKKSEAGSVKRALASLRLSDVLPVGASESESLNFETTYTATLKDGTIYHAAMATEGEDKFFLQLSAEYGEVLLTDDDLLTTETEAAANMAATGAEAAIPEFNATHAPWIYEISSWTGKNLTKNKKDLVEEIPPPEPEAEAAVAPQDAPSMSPPAPLVLAPEAEPADDSHDGHGHE